MVEIGFPEYERFEDGIGLFTRRFLSAEEPSVNGQPFCGYLPGEVEFVGRSKPVEVAPGVWQWTATFAIKPVDEPVIQEAKL